MSFMIGNDHPFPKVKPTIESGPTGQKTRQPTSVKSDNAKPAKTSPDKSRRWN